MSLGFGLEVEVTAEPRHNTGWTPAQHYVRFAEILSNHYNLPATGNTSNYKYPGNYNRWWITNDSSLSAPANSIKMECVSPPMRSSDDWQTKVNDFWRALKSMFNVQKNLTCGAHVHVAPWGTKFTLQQAKVIAFATCYYEPYVISCLPNERRDHKYCLRNSKVRSRMGALCREKTARAMNIIASEIKQKSNEKGLCSYMQGGLEARDRYVLWNFQNLYRTNTIEFRGGRHLRGKVRTKRWVTFVIVFVLMALQENLLYSHLPDKIPHNGTANEVQNFWRKLRQFAATLNLSKHLPVNFKMMSEKKPSRARQR